MSEADARAPGHAYPGANAESHLSSDAADHAFTDSVHLTNANACAVSAEQIGGCGADVQWADVPHEI